MNDLSSSPTAGNPAAAPTPPAWHDFRVVAFAGRESQKATGLRYRAVPLVRLFDMPPAAQPKIDGPAFIPSTHCEHDARVHAAQRKSGQYVALTGDVDEGDQPLEAIEASVRAFAGGAAYLIYSSPSSRPGNRKWRAIIALASPVGYQTWYAAQTLFHNHLAEAGIKPDRALARAAQIVFMPNVPPVHDGSGTPLREGGSTDGAPLYFERSHFDVNADGLDLDCGGIAIDLMVRIAIAEADEAERREAAKEAARMRQERAAGGDSPIERFNRKNDLYELLERFGYEAAPDSDQDWRSPHQTSGSYATRATTDDDGRQWWLSLSGSDLAARVGRACGGGCHGDAFDLFVHFEHNGDQGAALAALRIHEGIEGLAGVTIDPPEYCSEAERPGLHKSPLEQRLLRQGGPLRQEAWLIKGLVPKLGTGLLVAPSGAGKTTVAGQLAKSLATGEPFFGKPIKEKCGTLILAAEGLGGLQPRLNVLSADSPLPIYALPLATLGTEAALAQVLSDVADVAELCLAEHEMRLGLVILDTLAASGLITNENDNSECAAAIKKLERIAVTAECLALTTHHTPKVGGDPRGGSALGAGVDIILTITRAGLAKVRGFQCSKGRDSQEGSIGSFTLIPEPVGVDDDGDPITACVVSMSDGPAGSADLPSRQPPTPGQVAEILDRIGEGAPDGLSWRFSYSSGDSGDNWAGVAIGDVMGFTAQASEERSFAQGILNDLIKSSALSKGQRGDPSAPKNTQRKPVPFVKLP